MLCILKFTKGNNSVKSVVGATVLVLCTVSDDALYVYHKFQENLKGFQRNRPEHWGRRYGGRKC